MQSNVVHYLSSKEVIGEVVKQELGAIPDLPCPHVSAGHSDPCFALAEAWPEFIIKQFEQYWK